MVPPAASIRSMVMLSGLGAFPFFYCLTASSTSHGSTSGKSGDQCCTYGSGGSGSGRFRWVESFKEFLCSVNNSAPVYCQRAVLLLNSCKLKLSAAEFFSLPFWNLFLAWLLLELIPFSAFWNLNVVSFLRFFSVLLLQLFLELKLVVGDSFVSPSDLGFLWSTSWPFCEELRTLWLSLPEIWRCCWDCWRVVSLIFPSSSSRAAFLFWSLIVNSST